jgi:hypothetical protein
MAQPPISALQTRGCSEGSHSQRRASTGGERRDLALVAGAALAEDTVPSRRPGRRAPEMLGRGVARLPGQVARGRADLEHPFVADLHGAGFRASGLADVPGACAGDCHHPRGARLAVVGGDRRSALEGLTIRVGAWWALEDDVAARHPVHVEPPIVRSGHAEAQRIVVGISPTDQDLPPRMVKISKPACHLWRSILGNPNRRPIKLTLEVVPANSPEADQGFVRSVPYYSSRQLTHGARPHQR